MIFLLGLLLVLLGTTNGQQIPPVFGTATHAPTASPTEFESKCNVEITPQIFIETEYSQYDVMDCSGNSCAMIGPQLDTVLCNTFPKLIISDANVGSAAYWQFEKTNATACISTVKEIVLADPGTTCSNNLATHEINSRFGNIELDITVTILNATHLELDYKGVAIENDNSVCFTYLNANQNPVTLCERAEDYNPQDQNTYISTICRVGEPCRIRGIDLTQSQRVASTTAQGITWYSMANAFSMKYSGINNPVNEFGTCPRGNGVYTNGFSHALCNGASEACITSALTVTLGLSYNGNHFCTLPPATSSPTFNAAHSNSISLFIYSVLVFSYLILLN